jgi:hypothetical protein
VTVAGDGEFAVDAIVIAVDIVVPVMCALRLDHILCVLGHPFDQSLRGAVVIIIAAHGCSVL